MLQLQKEQCCGCGACVNVCPNGSISWNNDEEGFFYPSVNKDSCVNCGLCVAACPYGKEIDIKEPKVIGAVNNNLEDRLRSSSGGIFILLAKKVLADNGVVIGAAIDDDMRVTHIGVEREEELFRLQGSKYVQSHMGTIYQQVKELLRNERKVLFSGTPCQVYGLKTFLKKEYKNLICVDFICHGVPSPLVWEKFVAMREEKAGVKAKAAFFRDKKFGWRKFSMSLIFENNTRYIKTVKNDAYLKAFTGDVCLRPSCYQCEFKGFHRWSDITLADFWKVEEYCPNLDDNQGTSLILINNSKGQEMVREFSDEIDCDEIDFVVVSKTNSAYFNSAKMPKCRAEFMRDILSDNIEKVSKKYCTNSFRKRVKSKICRMLQKG